VISRKQIEDVLRPHFGTSKALRVAVRDVQNLAQQVGASRPAQPEKAVDLLIRCKGRAYAEQNYADAVADYDAAMAAQQEPK
jgi:glucose-6-phosphate dehydrogenase assembly protein OpcA